MALTDVQIRKVPPGEKPLKLFDAGGLFLLFLLFQPGDSKLWRLKWGDRLFYPGNRIVKGRPQPRLRGDSARLRATAIRERIEATVDRRAPQVMVKVTGGGRSMKAIAAHFRYISKNGRLDIEDERGETMRGKDCLHELADDWRFGGTLIDDIAEPGQRREAFNIMLSMPRGTDPSPCYAQHARSRRSSWRTAST